MSRSDAEDLQQELALHVVARLPRYDPARAARSTFVDRIVGNKLLNLLASRAARKRDPGRTGSIHEGVEESVRDARAEDPDLRLDVADAVASLPDDLRPVACCLMMYTPAEAQRVLGLTRGQVRQRIDRIARHFEDFPDFHSQSARRSGR